MELDLNRVLQIARRWWWLLVLAPILGGMTAFLVTMQQPEEFSAEVTLLVSSGVNAANAGSIQASQNLTETYRQWAVARPVLQNAAEILAYEGGVDELEEVVSSSVVPDTLLVRISAIAESPEDAATIANTVADEFLTDVVAQSSAQNSQVRSTIELQRDDTTARLTAVQERIDELRALAAPTTADREELATLLNEETTLRADLTQLETTLRTIDTELATGQTRIVILAPAVPPEQPFAPNVIQATAIGTFAGLALAVAAAIVLEYMDDTIRDREELPRIAKVPVLAGVATVAGLKRRGEALFVIANPSSSSAEAMRLLRTNLEFASAPNQLSTLAISSPQPDEGKSTITANLGVVLAQAGLKTLIIDADLRHPSQHIIFGVGNRRGLSTLLVSPDPNWREGTTPLSIPNLAIITSGPIPPNPPDLLRLERFSTLLEQAREWADVVLIDSPPVLAASDALIIANRTSGMLLVCRHGVTRRGALRRTIATLEQSRAKVMGVVFNHLRSDTIDHYGRYGEDGDGDATHGGYFFGRGDQVFKATPTTEPASPRIEIPA